MNIPNLLFQTVIESYFSRHLYSALAITPDQGQVIELLWQKLWNREAKAKPPEDETPEAKMNISMII